LTDATICLPGLIVANYGRHFLVETSERRRVICHSRGKKSEGVVGDRVTWRASQDQGTIETIEPRRNLFYRRDELRTKSFAANLDQVLILVAAEPAFSTNQLSRALIAAEAQHIAPLILLNKSDMGQAFARAWNWLAPYRDMGYTVLPCSLKHGDAQEKARLTECLRGKTTLVLGPSGAGKSTLINLVAAGALAQTGEISQALRSGKHTTTSTTWYWLDDDGTSAVIDSPGFQEFGLRHVQPMQLAQLMPDLRAHADHCRFYNCTHLHEPGCGVISALPANASDKAIHPERYRIYQELFAELSQGRY
jgi:ribosome biogenesis GTPase